MKYLNTPDWIGYSKTREGATDLLTLEDDLENTTQHENGREIAGAVELGMVRWTFAEDASVLSIKQKLIDHAVIAEIKIEDCLKNKAKTVIRRMTLTNVRVVSTNVKIESNGDGVATVA